MNRRLSLSIALVTALAAAPAFAQSSPATLQIEGGSAMISTGGEFTTIASGAQVPGGSRLMLSEGARATLVYPNGCTKALGSAGVFNITGTCYAAGSGGGGGAVASGTGLGSAIASNAGAIGLLVGGTVAVAAGLNSMDEVPAPPISR